MGDIFWVISKVCGLVFGIIYFLALFVVIGHRLYCWVNDKSSQDIYRFKIYKELEIYDGVDCARYLMGMFLSTCAISFLWFIVIPGLIVAGCLLALRRVMRFKKKVDKALEQKGVNNEHFPIESLV